MAKHGCLAKHGIVNSVTRKDLLFSGLPGLFVLLIGLVVSANDGYDGLVGTLWDLIRGKQGPGRLAGANMAGLVLIILGLTIALIAVGTLRRFYSSALVIRHDHRLITHGIYRFMRHPIYFGILMIVFGPPVYALSLSGFLIMSVLIPIILNRIRMEERLLTDAFDDDYREYKRSTRKLIPLIY